MKKEWAMGMLILYRQPAKKLSEGKLIDINEESSCNKKDKDVPREKTIAKKLYINATLKDI